MMKRLAVVVLILFNIVPSSFGDPAQEDQEARNLDNFIVWRKQLNWNIGSQLDYFLDGNVYNTVRPLNGQWKVWTGNGGAELWKTTRDVNVNTRVLTKKIPWVYNCDEIPIVLFGEKAGRRLCKGIIEDN